MLFDQYFCERFWLKRESSVLSSISVVMSDVFYLLLMFEITFSIIMLLSGSSARSFFPW